ncbi:mediator of RNA polymerase II transcription subunit 15a [Carex littledalei]|uniref:Mediator of RNA polymerase II transcription subunit 15a n=1 Tax=Carex littledalei TaxID=544730 RepID=A0A833R037_9POAL|nr:mediator of RNA polymerase II transcription subunit 15a [Carex littledalei]
MDSNWNAPQSGGATGPSSGVVPDPNANPDWRSQLQPDARQRIVNKIMDTLKRHLPVPVPEGINELQKIAVRFEEKIYSAATSQPDYLRKISLKMLSMENKTQSQLNSVQQQPVHNTMKTRKCRICEDCMHKRRNTN